MLPIVRIIPIIILLLPLVMAHAGEFDIAEAPSWVTEIPAPDGANPPKTQISDGVYYLLLDRQTQVGREQTRAFTRVLKKVLTPQGVETASQIYINFDPSYQRLALHHINIHRDGKAINQLHGEKITVIQRESDLERRLYNGQKTASIILEDTRPGDTIEYAFTLTGSNPVFEGRYMVEVDTAWAVPLAALHYRWRFTNGLPVFHKAYHCSKSITSLKVNNGVEYRYRDEQIGATIADEDLPAWYQPYPRIQITQFKDWADVGRWGKALYPIPREVSPALQARIDALGREGTLSEKVAAALCLVQNEIRYLGIEIGAGSYRPTAPDVTYRRKFGDCKDKTILLCTMLNKMGVDARPALVHTRMRGAISDQLPSPLLFNHVIACVKDGEKTHWVDPTGYCQKVPMAKQYPALYGKALILAQGTRALTGTGEKVLDQPSREIHEKFDLTQGVDQPATFSIKTIFRGREADRVRNQIKSKGFDQTAKSYLNFYAADYPSIVQENQIATHSDPDTNDLVITENYRIPSFWKRSEGKKESLAIFYAREFYSLFQQPATAIRSMPIGLSHPNYVTHRITVLLPEPWSVTTGVMRVENDAVIYTDSVDYADEKLTIDYSYRTKQDYVAVDQSAAYIADIKKIRDQIGYQLGYTHEASPTGASGVIIGAILAGLLVAAALAILVWRYDPLPMEKDSPKDESGGLKGLGGWLIVVLIGLLLRPAVIVSGLAEVMPAFSLDYWHKVNEMIRPGFDFAYKLLVGTEVAASIIFVVLLFVLVPVFFKRRSSFPYLFIGITVAHILYLILNAVLGGAMFMKGGVAPGEIHELVLMAVFTAIWSMYMVTSSRVRQTFRRRRGHSGLDGAARGVMLEARSEI